MGDSLCDLDALAIEKNAKKRKHLISFPETRMEELFRPFIDGDIDMAKKMMKKNPDFDINWKDPSCDNRCALHYSCNQGYDVITPFLLEHPKIDVNSVDKEGSTPFYYACTNAKHSSMKFMLSDPRVLINKPNKRGITPINTCIANADLLAVKLMISSERELSLGDFSENIDSVSYTKATETFLKWLWGDPESKAEGLLVLELLEKYKQDPSGTTEQVKLELYRDNPKRKKQ